jgi:hypothetical protein
MLFKALNKGEPLYGISFVLVTDENNSQNGLAARLVKALILPNKQNHVHAQIKASILFLFYPDNNGVSCLLHLHDAWSYLSRINGRGRLVRLALTAL